MFLLFKDYVYFRFLLPFYPRRFNELIDIPTIACSFLVYNKTFP